MDKFELVDYIKERTEYGVQPAFGTRDAVAITELIRRSPADLLVSPFAVVKLVNDGSEAIVEFLGDRIEVDTTAPMTFDAAVAYVKLMFAKEQNQRR